MKQPVEVKRQGDPKQLLQAIKRLSAKRVLIGITEDTSSNRRASLLAMEARTPGIVAKADLMRAAKEDIGNAELLYILSHGSPLKGIPARPVLEPSIVFPANRDAIAPELVAAAKATLAGDEATATAHLKRAGIAGQRAAQGWITNPANGFAPNAPATIKAKGSSRPLVDTGALRQAITYVVEQN